MINKSGKKKLMTDLKQGLTFTKLIGFQDSMRKKDRKFSIERKLEIVKEIIKDCGPQQNIQNILNGFVLMALYTTFFSEEHVDKLKMFVRK